jgi:hypothetical protein
MRIFVFQNKIPLFPLDGPKTQNNDFLEKAPDDILLN